jgi:hypothetical protein
MMKYIKIIRNGHGGYIQPLHEMANAIDGEFDGSEIGDTITLKLVEMSEEEYENLPEFTGW